MQHGSAIASTELCPTLVLSILPYFSIVWLMPANLQPEPCENILNSVFSSILVTSRLLLQSVVTGMLCLFSPVTMETAFPGPGPGKRPHNLQYTYNIFKCSTRSTLRDLRKPSRKFLRCGTEVLPRRASADSGFYP